ncbi:thioredoxin-like protein [Coemansia reversa NRRL 1564]|uniref:Thioredoxin-like protein n=1 Tax=Coemansia reversa (strain ATCC 12441 / NRRL 1564) TaxID=763665 RepID=A0A2G5B8J8_COERN|nr:thioredoxin-like protein [Coemansia reversa NRRL 1564]|eukprot:PIA15324.1 thioredoxin-like protein [Coemansia reversa NRRL 1564]
MNPDEDTEWNDILRKHGILPQQIKITQNDIYDQAVARAQEEESKRLEELGLDELAELEDEEDDRVLEQYKRQRLAEMQAQQSKEKYGTLEHISEPQYKKEVTEASKGNWIVVHLFRESIPECKLMNRILSELAQQYRATKFVKIISVECIHNYPDANLPTLLVYGEGDMKNQLVRIDRFGGMRTKRRDIENYLKDIGAIDPSLRRSLPGESDEESDNGEDQQSAYFDLGRARS